MQLNVHFACELLHFCQLLSNPSIDLEFEYIFGKPMNVDSNDILSVWKYYQLFMQESNTFLLQNMTLKPFGQWQQTTPKSTLPLEARGPPYMNVWVTPLTNPNDIRIQSAILPQYTLQTDQPTDRLTDRRSRRMFHNISTTLAMLIDSGVLIIITRLIFMVLSS